MLKRKKVERERAEGRGVGLILFSAVKEGMVAEAALKKAGLEVAAVVPPEELRKGCDVAVRFNMVERLGVERFLKDKGVKFHSIISLEAPSRELLDLVKTFDFGDSVMVRAGPMKITYEKVSGIIRNISGGGCPDVPYLHLTLLGKPLDQVPSPSEIGRTLCAYLLDRAFNEALELWRGSLRS